MFGEGRSIRKSENHCSSGAKQKTEAQIPAIEPLAVDLSFQATFPVCFTTVLGSTVTGQVALSC